jgi:hypothetical protein
MLNILYIKKPIKIIKKHLKNNFLCILIYNGT